MGWRIAEEVQEYAPTSLTWRDLYIANVLANLAKENTRTCRPGLLSDEAVMRRLRMSDKRELLRVIERLIEAKVIERTARGQKWQQAEFRFLPLGPARPAQDGDPTHPEDSSGWGVSPLRVGNSSAQGGGNPHPSQVLKEDQVLLLPSQVILREAGLGLTEEEEKDLIAWSNHEKPKNTSWWVKLATEGDLGRQVARWRQAVSAAATEAASVRSGLPEWCGNCGGDDPSLKVNAKGNIKFRTLGECGAGEKCPDCHPEARR